MSFAVAVDDRHREVVVGDQLQEAALQLGACERQLGKEAGKEALELSRARPAVRSVEGCLHAGPADQPVDERLLHRALELRRTRRGQVDQDALDGGARDAEASGGFGGREVAGGVPADAVTEPCLLAGHGYINRTWFGFEDSA